MLELIRLHKTFGQKTVADHISLTVPAGRLLAVLGASGGGKTTLLHMAAGLVRPDSGQIRIGGRDVTGIPPERRRTGLMFQDYALFPHLTVAQNLAFGPAMHGIPAAERRIRITRILADIGLENEAQRMPDSLSGGEQQRAALARAMLIEPELLLLDEPYSNLDSHRRHDLRTLTLAQIRHRNIPAVLVTHDPAEALQMADEIALMQNGRIIQQGAPAELLHRPASAAAARLLGLANVSPDRYIPPQAVRPSENGTPSRVSRILLHPQHSQIIVQHPEWGSLHMPLPPSAAVPETGSLLNISVDRTAVVIFDPAA
ncbi:ABC transporter ATP-binding protein [Neisseria leonii]|uniref:ABC transporter ATP-binding protein n=1 Tax=Neisseria leonii TaxID=2995413 RepID=A0A9X4E3N5_9NEIS|nr:ABC transporter ATP-binding protein [Neisseria sp. 51.81]MDD9328140.1 ABC transporter ATP-binding protein [Neisseria sp. 51.81]